MTNPFGLTDRELEVARVVVECGGSTKDAAQRLGVSRNGIRNHRSSCIRKAGVETSAEFWIAMGWMRIPPRR